MNTYLTEVSAWMISLCLAVSMLIGWVVGYWGGGHVLPTEGQERPASKFNDAILALLGLLLAFTFSMSLVKHDQRRQMVVTEGNAIGDFYTCVSLLKEPQRAKLQATLRQYVTNRLSIADRSPDEVLLLQHLQEIEQLHGQMQVLVGQAVDEGTPITVPLVNTLNGVTSSHTARLAAVRDRLPATIVLLLFLAAVVSMLLMGWQQGLTRERRFGAVLGFVALVCMVVLVILDLNQPRQGSITVSQEPLQRLLVQMKSSG